MEKRIIHFIKGLCLFLIAVMSVLAVFAFLNGELPASVAIPTALFCVAFFFLFYYAYFPESESATEQEKSES